MQIIQQIADSANSSKGRFSYDEWQRKHFDNIVSVLEKEQRIASRQTVVEELPYEEQQVTIERITPSQESDNETTTVDLTIPQTLGHEQNYLEVS